jgi:hypothetical protein
VTSISTLAKAVGQAARSRPHGIFRSVLTAGIIVAGGIFPVAIPAQAAQTATISRPIGLAASSSGVAFLPEYPGGNVRRIYLAQGTYTWGYTFSTSGNTAQSSRQIFLDAGWYNWGCTILGTGGAYPDADNYMASCQLDPVNTSLSIAYLPNNPSSWDYWDLKPATWTWTSYLTPHF